MSDEEQEFSNQQEEDEENDEEDEEDDQDGDDDDEDQDGSDEDQDQDGSDEDEDGSDQDGQDDDEDGSEEEDGDEEQSKNQEAPMPSFGRPQFVETEQFKFRNLVAQISSLGTSIDSFINTLPSRGGSHYRSYQPKIEPIIPKTFEVNIPEQPPPKRQYTIMKDEDIQVSMQPQIVVQQTLIPKEQPKKQPYRISNQSTKFLAQLYEENKKLKRWQNTQLGSQSNGFYKSKEKFERPEHQRGLINIDDRNREIDEAIQMLRREDYQDYS